MESHPKVQNSENTITLIPQHEHPLQLVDLQPCYPDYVEYSDDEEEDRVIKWDFNSLCDECGNDINVYHRYYYKCTDSCDYVFHKGCAKAPPTTLVVKSHHPTHKLSLSQPGDYCYCYDCHRAIHDDLYYRCSICPDFYDSSIHVKCAMIGRENHTIYHPSHSHPLMIVMSQPISCNCDACGNEHRGIFYHCTTCFDYTIHADCAFLPRKLQIHHTHPLTISYSSYYMDRSLKVVEDFPCRICREPFGLNYPWIYKCESCRYFVHLDCATSRYESFLSAGLGKTIKNFKDADHPNLVNLPFPDQTHSILQHWSSKESVSTSETSERKLNHISHQHVLNLVGTHSNDSKGATSSSVSSVSCHNPMKRIELLCNGCVRPIMDVPFYKCSSECDFVLHEWCTRLPAELTNYPGHPQHSLIFLSKVPGDPFGIFYCRNCELYCNGFAYGCTKCKYYVDVNCGFIPDEITHDAHPDHILSHSDLSRKRCVADGITYLGNKFTFSCRSCDFYLHSASALFLPRIINHKLDKHPMKLTYGPVENHKSEYFCEVCEEVLNPSYWFYHCHVCLYSLHTRCAPVIVNSEAAVNNNSSLYKYLNIKFGGIYNIKGHEHSVSLAQGFETDGRCSRCEDHLRERIILKCLNCKFTAHWDCRIRYA